MMNPSKYQRQYFMPPVKCMKWADPDDPPLWKNTAAHTGAFKTWFCFTGDLYFFGKACHCGL